MESTLSLKLSDYLSQVGFYLGIGLGADLGDPAWTARQDYLVKSDVDSGLKLFYYPPPVPPAGEPHDWSFLKPVASLDFPEATQHVSLPGDFGGFEGEVTILSPDSSSAIAAWPVKLVSIGMIHRQYAESPDATGRPQVVALSPNKGTGNRRGSTTDLWVFPETDTDYTFQFQYYLLPDALTVVNPYPYGGMAHSDTLLEACLSISESRKDDVPLQQANHYAAFLIRLAASVHVDSRNKPQSLGYNRDRSDGGWRYGDGRGRWSNWPTVSVNGVDY